MKEVQFAGLESLLVEGKKEVAIIMLHGYGANCHDLFPLHDYLDSEGYFDWYFPQGPISIPFSGLYEGRAWFSIDVNALEESMRTGVPREFGNKSSIEFTQNLKLLNSFVSEIKKNYKKVVIGGFSQGAMLSCHVAHPDALILMSGVLFDEKNLLDRKAFKDLKVFQSHGRGDSLLSYKEGEKLNQFLKENGALVQMNVFEGGHEIPPTVLSSLKKFLDLLKQ